MKNQFGQNSLKKDGLTGNPLWVKNKFYSNYKCIERLLIVAARNKYIHSGNKEELRYI